MGKIAGKDMGTPPFITTVMEGVAPLVIPLTEGSRMFPSAAGLARANASRAGLPLVRRSPVLLPSGDLGYPLTGHRRSV